MHDLSFTLHNPRFLFNGLRFSIQVFTFENVYTLDEAACNVIENTADTFILRASRLLWAGGQEPADGSVDLCARRETGHTTFQISATCVQTIRSVKLVIHDVPNGTVMNLRETPSKSVPPQGLILHYPEGWRNLYTPLVIYQSDDATYSYFRSLDTEVRDKKFVFVRRGDRLDVELLFEELATRMTKSVNVPTWEVGAGDDPHTTISAHQAHVEAAYGLRRWHERADIPGWMYDISLIASIHCQHFTGYIFNSYEQVLEKIRWLAQHIEPQRVLVYLPGWEGRYYWQYGDYRPDPRMGGADGFARLIDRAHDLGVRVMPMFGMNVVNRGMANFEQWGAGAVATSAGGMTGGGTVDWDGSRHYDHGWGAFLNIGAPTWRNRLLNQINDLIMRYGFDGVFLDISAGWMNDPHYDMYEGTRQVIEGIRAHFPDVLVAGEGWYDALGALLPLHQSGHTEGVMHRHDDTFPTFFDSYNRGFAHLCLGDPGRGSTGVHELGYNPCWREPLRKGVIPTVTLVEDTVETAPDRVLEIIEDARRYCQMYLAGC